MAEIMGDTPLIPRSALPAIEAALQNLIQKRGSLDDICLGDLATQDLPAELARQVEEIVFHINREEPPLAYVMRVIGEHAASDIQSILDARLPQPPYEGLPAELVAELNQLQTQRKACPPSELEAIEQKILALLRPYAVG